MPRGRADAHHLLPDVPGLHGELWRIHPHRAGRPARGGTHHVPGRAAHLGKAALGHHHQDAGDRAAAPQALPAGPGRLHPVGGKTAQPVHADRSAWATPGTYWLVLRALQNFIGLRRAKVALTGAAPIAPDVVRFFRSIGVPLIEVYGLTESTGMVTGHRLDAVRRLGRPAHPRRPVHCRIGDSGGESDSRRDGVPGLPQIPGGHSATPSSDGSAATGDVVREA